MLSHELTVHSKYFRQALFVATTRFYTLFTIGTALQFDVVAHQQNGPAAALAVCREAEAPQLDHDVPNCPQTQGYRTSSCGLGRVRKFRGGCFSAN